KARIEPHLPAVPARNMALATREHQRNAEFVVQPQEIGRWISHELSAEGEDLCFGLRHDLRMQAPQEAVDLEEAVVAVRRETYHLVGTDQTPEAVGIHGRGWHAFGFVDHDPREESPVLVEGPQALDQLLVAIASRPRPDDALGGVEHIWRNDGLKGA